MRPVRVAALAALLASASAYAIVKSPGGSGGGGGAVTSVGLVSADGCLNFTGSPITTSGNISIALATPCTPPAWTLTNATGLPLTTGVTGVLPVANGGTGVTTSTGTGSNVLNTSPTLVTPNLGTPSAINLTNATALSASALSYGSPISATLSTTQNNYSPASWGPGKYFSWTPPAGGATITGLSATGWGAGQTAVISNASTTLSVTFSNQSASSSAGNQFLNANAAPATLAPGSSTGVLYDGTNFRFY